MNELESVGYDTNFGLWPPLSLRLTFSSFLSTPRLGVLQVPSPGLLCSSLARASHRKKSYGKSKMALHHSASKATAIARGHDLLARVKVRRTSLSPLASLPHVYRNEGGRHIILYYKPGGDAVILILLAVQ